MKGFYLRIILALTCALTAHTAEAASKKNQKSSIKIKPADRLIDLIYQGKSFVCMDKAGKAVPGNFTKDATRFSLLEPKYQTKIKNYKQKRKTAKLNDKKKQIQKYKKLIKAMQAEIKGITSACHQALNCTISSSGADYTITENNEFNFSLNSDTTCQDEIKFEIISPPAGELTQLTGRNFKYYAGFRTGSDSFTFRACSTKFNRCSEPSTVTFTIGAGENIGRSSSAAPYRNIITEKEARHLLKKIGFNNHLILTDDLKENGGYNLEAIINKLLDPNYVAPDLKPMLELLRDGRKNNYTGIRNVVHQQIFSPSEKFDTPDQQIKGLEKLIDNFAKGYDLNRLAYAGSFSATIPIYRARYLSPTRALLENIWHGHFGTSFVNLGAGMDYFIRDYIELIHQNSLGNFRELILGTSPTSCLNGIGAGVLCDPASNFWLSNIHNKYNAPNQNFGRELLELYLLGPKDHYTGEPNYDEQDIKAATAAVSGYKLESYTSPDGAIPNPSRPVERFRLVFDSALHDFADFTAFARTPYERRGSNVAPQFVEHIFNSHPGLPRFIAGKLLRMLAFPDVSEALVQEMADFFKNNNFDIAKLVHKIASSEAMFSQEAAEPKCIKEPLRLFLEPLRNLEIPLFGSVLLTDGNALKNNYGHYGWISNVTPGWLGSMTEFYRILTAAGETPLLYESVFTHDYCGRSPANTGKGWTVASYLLNRIKGALKIIARNAWMHHTDFYYHDILKKGLKPGETIFAMTPSRLIEFFNQSYNVELSPEEYTVIERYLTHRLDALEKEVYSGWNPANNQLMDEKIAGLIVIYTSMSQSNVY